MFDRTATAPLAATAAALATLAFLGCDPVVSGGPASLPVQDELARATGPLRPDSPLSTDLFTFDEGDLVETWDAPGGRVRVHFTRNGPNAVPGADTDGSGIPDFAELVGASYEDVLAFYRDELGFREPISDEDVAGGNGGDSRFDVYLVDFGGNGDGAYRNDECGYPGPAQCAGYMVQENDFKGYGYPSLAGAIRILSSHELFHAVQAAYDIDQGSPMAEGSAVWATEAYDPSLDDLEGFLPGFFANADRPLDEPLPGPVDAFSYGMGIFFQFLTEWAGPDAVRLLWEACVDGAGGTSDPAWLTVLPSVLESGFTTDMLTAMVEFASWNLLTGGYADPERGYAHGEDYPDVAAEEVALPFDDDAVRVYHASTAYLTADPGGRTAVTAALYGDDASETHLGLVLAVRRAKKLVGPTRILALGAGQQAVATQPGDELVLALVNAAPSGSSLKPGLCFGSPGEVSACLATHATVEPDAESGDISDDADGSTGKDASSADGAGGAEDPDAEGASNGAQADATPDGAQTDLGAEDDGTGSDSGGCRAAAGGGAPFPGRAAPWLLAIFLLGYRRRSGVRSRPFSREDSAADEK